MGRSPLLSSWTSPLRYALHGKIRSVVVLTVTRLQTVTITHVTLKVGGNYEVEFVNPQNHSQVYATSNSFDVKAPGSTSHHTLCMYPLSDYSFPSAAPCTYP